MGRQPPPSSGRGAYGVGAGEGGRTVADDPLGEGLTRALVQISNTESASQEGVVGILRAQTRAGGGGKQLCFGQILEPLAKGN